MLFKHFTELFTVGGFDCNIWTLGFVGSICQLQNPIKLLVQLATTVLQSKPDVLQCSHLRYYQSRGEFVLIKPMSFSCDPAWWTHVAWSDQLHRSQRGPWCTRRVYLNCRCHPWSRHVSDTWLLWSPSLATRSWNRPVNWWRSSSRVVWGKGCRKAWSDGHAKQTTG